MVADMNSHWKWLAGSAAGTSHVERGEPCQDYAHALVVRSGPASVLLAACADGAGSASRAAEAARSCCLSILHLAAEYVRAGGSVRELTREIVLSWYEQARRGLSLRACLDNLPLREYACTLLLTAVDKHGAACAQVGDGAIVIWDGEGYRPVFWPQSGEYANTTCFVCGQDFPHKFLFSSTNAPPEEVALFTDGLQPLALHYATRSAHTPFFLPLFEALASHPPEDLRGPMLAFFDSPAVNGRTDDDKTLILATCRSPSHAVQPIV
jgi:hypothetical protein